MGFWWGLKTDELYRLLRLLTTKDMGIDVIEK
jgi:hypothetical protein